MTDKEKQAIEELKSLKNIYSYIVTYEKEYLLQCVETVLNLVETQAKELEKKDKVIHKMAEYINELDIEEDICCNIKEGDYVNGRLVLQVDYKNKNVCLLIPFTDTQANTNIMWYGYEDIKSILTKEQYEKYCYKVEG